MKTLALDISLYTGWALRGADGVTTFGTRNFSGLAGPGGCPIRVGRRFRQWIDGFLDEHMPDVLVIERPFFRGDVTWLLVGMAWEAQRAAEERGIARADYAVNSIKKHATGDGRAKKPEMVQAIRLRGFKVQNDHEADAVAIMLLHAEGQKPAPVDDQIALF